MAKAQKKRQSIRKALLFVSFLLFPVTINYFSPYIIVDGASQGIINGSFIIFGLMFISALVVGRFWCGWLCPAGGMQEFCFIINSSRAKGGWLKDQVDRGVDSLDGCDHLPGYLCRRLPYGRFLPLE